MGMWDELVRRFWSIRFIVYFGSTPGITSKAAQRGSTEAISSLLVNTKGCGVALATYVKVRGIMLSLSRQTNRITRSESWLDTDKLPRF